jgi:hypothetical protein
LRRTGGGAGQVGHGIGRHRQVGDEAVVTGLLSGGIADLDSGQSGEDFERDEIPSPPSFREEKAG